MGTTIDRATEDEWIRRIAQGEGYSATAMKDPVAGYDVGYGHSLTYNGGWDTVNKILHKPSSNRSVSPQEAADLCRHDLQTIYKELDRNFPWWKDLDKESQYVMVDMCYNMGAAKLKKFEKTLGALQQGDYATASRQMLNSRYARQTGQRARKNAELIRTGKWYDNDPKYLAASEILPTRHSGDPTRQQIETDTRNANLYAARQEEHVRAEQARIASAPARASTAATHTSASRTTAKVDKPKAPATTARTTAKANTGNAGDKEKNKMRTMLNNLNRRNGKNKQVDVDATIEALTKQYGDNASKILAKALMAPSTVAGKLNLRDENGKLLTSSRQIIQQLCKTDDEQQKNNALALVAAKKRGRGMA